MLDVNDLVEGVTKVRILTLPRSVTQQVGDIGVFICDDGFSALPLQVMFDSRCWWFVPKNLEIVQDEDVSNEGVPKASSDMSSQSEDIIIYKSRWDEIIDDLSKPLNFMTDEEVEVVKSVLKNNTPFNVVVEDPIIVDPVISKEEQTHLDANYVGTQGDPCFYYRSSLLKQWFWWNHSKWKECEFDFNELLTELFNPVSFGESK